MDALEWLALLVLALAVLLIPLSMAATIIEWQVRRRRGTGKQRRS
jgi:hypothetical protein